jgi:hypothetical protein
MLPHIVDMIDVTDSFRRIWICPERESPDLKSQNKKVDKEKRDAESDIVHNFNDDEEVNDGIIVDHEDDYNSRFQWYKNF